MTYTKEFVNSLLTIRETYPNQTNELWDRIHALKQQNDHLREMYSKVHSLYEAASKNKNNQQGELCDSVH